MDAVEFRVLIALLRVFWSGVVSIRRGLSAMGGVVVRVLISLLRVFWSGE
jgi:hypothetical protein